MRKHMNNSLPKIHSAEVHSVREVNKFTNQNKIRKRKCSRCIDKDVHAEQ